LRGVEAGIEDLARQALGSGPSNLHLVLALIDFAVWKSLRDHGISEAGAPELMGALLECARPPEKQ
jgi:hypothetical protein